MNSSQEAAGSVKRILLNDRLNTSSNFINVLRSDIFELLSQYMEVNPNSINIDINADKEHYYEVRIGLNATRIKSINVLK
jgi:septum formation topological specificity factor MinE